MGISPAQWLTAFAIAVALHVLAGTFVWVFEHTPDAPPHSPRGIMVSLDALSTGNTPQSTQTPQSVTPVPAAPAAHTPAPTPPRPADAVTPAPTPTGTATPAPVTPQPVQPEPAGSTGATASANGVDIPVAAPVTINSADTVAVSEQVATVPAHTAPARPTRPNPGSGAQGLSSDPTVSYIAHIRSWLSQHKYYPVAARRNSAQGTVRLYLVVARDGRVLNVAIARSSGNPALNQAALDMVKRAEPLPAMPDELLRTRLEIILPVRYALAADPADATK